MNDSFTVFEAKADQKLFGYFRAHGFAVLKDSLTSDEVMHFVQLYDKDRKEFGPPNC